MHDIKVDDTYKRMYMYIYFRCLGMLSDLFLKSLLLSIRMSELEKSERDFYNMYVILESF